MIKHKIVLDKNIEMEGGRGFEGRYTATELPPRSADVSRVRLMTNISESDREKALRDALHRDREKTN